MMRGDKRKCRLRCRGYSRPALFRKIPPKWWRAC